MFWLIGFTFSCRRALTRQRQNHEWIVHSLQFWLYSNYFTVHFANHIITNWTIFNFISFMKVPEERFESEGLNHSDHLINFQNIIFLHSLCRVTLHLLDPLSSSALWSLSFAWTLNRLWWLLWLQSSVLMTKKVAMAFNLIGREQ